MTSPDSPTPPIVGGRYELGEPLGRGGMAEVRRAVDNRLGRSVAVKQLRADLATDPTFQARFRREAQSAAGLNHPNIVAVYDTGEEPDPGTGVQVPYIVMELVEGPTLRDILREGRKILPERALELTAGVLDALTYSHRAGIVHRDIKPANVMLTPGGTVKVMDFGIARAVADTSATMTQTAAVIGTAQYLSPEQARGETVDARSDLYSAGCLMYELLVGKPPFTGESPVSVAYQHVREAPVPPSQVDPSLGPDIDAVALKALAKEPDDRYQSAREMKADVTRVMAGEQATAVVPAAHAAEPDADATRVVPAVAPTSPDSSAPLPGSGPEDLDEEPEEEERKGRAGLAAGIIVAVLLVLGAAAALGWWILQPEEPQAAPPPQQVAVPDVIGSGRDQAEELLKSRGLEANVVQVNGPDDNTVNTVIAQDPDADQMVDPGSTVEVELNVGPKMATVPDDLIGERSKDAKAALKEAGFAGKDIERVEADPATEPIDADPNEVLAVDPEGGSTVPVGTTVTLTTATGNSPVPNLVGSLAGPAEQEAEDAGFDISITEVEDPNNAVGVVLSQTPKPDTLMQRGSTIEVRVAVAPPEPEPTEPPETSAPETSAPETSAPETSAPETSAPETSAPEDPETSAPETSGPGNGNGNGGGNGGGKGGGGSGPG